MRLWRRLKQIWNNSSIKKKLILYFMATIMLLSATNIYPYYSISVLMNKMSGTFEMNVKLNSLHKSLEKLDYAYENYLTTKHSKNLSDYYKYSSELRKEAESIQMDYSSIENILMMKNIKNMISTYLEEIDAAVTARRGRMVDEYLLHYRESARIHQYINEYIQKLNNTLFLQNTDRYMSVKSRFNIVHMLNIGIICSIIALSILLILWFTYRITNPISELSKAADEITHGNFNVPSVKVDSNDEIGVMAEAFNRMTGSIRQYINEIKEKAELESRLKEQEMENLIMKSNLKEAELHALQAQINPHFLFNTLNAGAQIAMLEGADRACSFIESAAELFRYNLRNLDKPVTIGDEIRNVENYTKLLNERFGDRIEFYLSKDESILGVKIPCMVLQPIVENAFIHGIGDLEETGRIWVKAERRGQNAEISVRDNGKGMPPEKIKEILNGEAHDKATAESAHKGHTNGIGLNNILSRLKIFYGNDKVLNIYSEPGKGTEVLLRIPINQD